LKGCTGCLPGKLQGIGGSLACFGKFKGSFLPNVRPRDGRAARPPPPPRLKTPPKISPKPPLSPCPDARPPKMSERSKSSCVDRNPPGKPAPPDPPNPPERTILRKLSYSLRSSGSDRVS